MDRKVGVAVVALAAALTPSRSPAQQTGTVTGQVVDETSRQPIADVQVSVIGTQRGAITDRNGRFTITGVPVGGREVRARRIGYGAATSSVQVVGGRPATLTFSLSPAASQLQEVVVNAVTGQQARRVEAGTNTGYLNVAEIPKGAITRTSDVLQGRVAGVNLSVPSGQVGSSQRIRIRGANSLSLSNEPLLFVDGVVVSNSKGGFTLGGQDYSRFNDINPEEIENIEILKGPAATAIYGSQAANGVVLITTRRGRAGSTQYRGYVEGAQSRDITNYPLNYAALSAFDRTQGLYVTNFATNDNGILNIRSLYGSTAGYDICPNFRAAIPAGQTVSGLSACAQDTVIAFNQFSDKRTTPLQDGARSKGGLNIQGGSEAVTYFLGADKEREQGTIRPNALDRTSLRTNLNAKVGSNANVGVTVAYVNTGQYRLSSDNSVFSPLINGFLGPAMYLPGMESDTIGRPGGRLGSYFGYNTADQRKVTANQDVNRFLLGSTANYTPFSWLRFAGNVGLDLFNRFDQQTQNPNELPLSQSYILGFRSASRAENSLWTANGSGAATFNLTRDLLSTTTLGVAYQRGLFRTTDCSGVGIPAGTKSCSATASQFAVSESYTDERTIGGFVQQQLSYADKVFLTGSLRADNNSGLVRQVSGLSYFPQANASWIISKERFFPTVPGVSQLRLRAGYGQAGQRPGYGAAETFYAPVPSQINGVEQSALVLTSTGNTALKIERTIEKEGGFDLSILRDRATLEYTYFNRTSKDALISRNLAPSAGLTGSVFQNLGQISNRGQELGLNMQLVQSGPVRLESRIQATVLKNRIDDLGRGIAPITLNRGAQAHRQGYPAGAYFARPITWNDADGNGKLTRAEVKVDSSRFITVTDTLGNRTTLPLAYLGASQPTNTQGLSFDLTLFNRFRIYTLLERRGGNKQLNETAYFRCRTQYANPYYSQCAALSNPNASLAEQAAFIASQFSEFGATRAGYIEDATFVKWRELTLRFDVPKSLASRARIKNGLAFSVSGRNLATWTKYTGLDPEINEGGGSNFTQGEFNTQPPVRTVTFRIDLQP